MGPAARAMIMGSAAMSSVLCRRWCRCLHGNVGLFKSHSSDGYPWYREAAVITEGREYFVSVLVVCVGGDLELRFSGCVGIVFDILDNLRGGRVVVRLKQELSLCEHVESQRSY